MPTTDPRFDRNEKFFGVEGQAKLRSASVVVVGAGGTGGHVIQQLAFLGTGRITVIDKEELDDTNKNRYITSQHDDPVPGSRKVDLAERLVRKIDPKIVFAKVPKTLISEDGFEAVMRADYVFGCVDREGVRMILAELCSAYGRVYFDVASEIGTEDKTRYGGRLVVSRNGNGCLLCLGELDAAEAGIDIAGREAAERRNLIYGLDAGLLQQGGPSVVTINGVIASLAATEFMVDITGIRQAVRLQKYYGHSGKVVVSTNAPTPNCIICSRHGKGADADVEHYIRDGIGNHL